MKTRHVTAARVAGLFAVALLAGACSSDSKSTSTSAAATTTAATTTAAATEATTPSTESPATSDATVSSDSTDTTGVSDSTAGTDTTGTVAAGADAFPVSIPNKFGATEITAKPERVVSIGYTDGDDILALGVKPVGIRDWYGNQPGALWPWATDSATGADITVLSSDSLDFESVAALKPDLIIGISSEIEQADYDKLTAIAPVLASDEQYIQFGTPWDVQQLTIGRALGLEPEAQTIVDDLTAKIADVTTQHPQWKGLTGNVAAINADGSSYLYTPADARGRFITDIGFTVPAEVSTLAGDLFYAQASAEQSALLDGDLLIYTTFSDADKPTVEASPLFTALKVVGDKHAIYVDQTVNAAMSFASTLSIPYAIDAIVPQIAVALGDADTATTTAGSTSATAGAIVPGADPEVDAVVTAYTTVFDSSTTYDQKAPYLSDAASVKATVDGYAAAGGAVNGIELIPTAVTISGDDAAITYDVLFAGTAVYNDLTGSAVKINGAWTITKDEFCGFMAEARNPCP